MVLWVCLWSQTSHYEKRLCRFPLSTNGSRSTSSNSSNSLELLTNLAQLIQAYPTMDAMESSMGSQVFSWWGVAQCFLFSHWTLPLWTPAPILDFLFQVQSCSYPLESSNDLGYLRPGAHCAWPCPQISLLHLCPAGVLLWLSPRMKLPALDCLATFIQGRDMPHVTGTGMKWLLDPKTCLWGGALLPPCIYVPWTKTSMDICSWPLNIIGSHLLDFLMDLRHPSVTARSDTSLPAPDRPLSVLFIKEPYHLRRPLSTWFPIEATVFHNDSLRWALLYVPSAALSVSQWLFP